MKKYLLLSALAWTTVALAKPVEVSEGTRFGRKVTVLNNGIVELAVTPEIGGRVLEFMTLATSNSVAKVRLDNIAKRPEDPWPGADYGGFTDVPSQGWPGPFWGKTYRLAVADGPVAGAKTLVLSASADGIDLERRLTLYPDSSRLTIAIRQCNSSGRDAVMNTRLHAEMAAGSLADNADTLFFPTNKEGALEGYPYIVGAEYRRFRWIEPSENWLAIADTVEKEGVVRKFASGAKAPRLFFWNGSNESSEQLGNQGAFFALDWYGDNQVVGAGKCITAEEEMFLFTGLPRVDFVNQMTAGALLLNRARYGASDKVLATVALASADALSANRAEIKILQGDKELGTLQCTVPPALPGQAAQAKVAWPYENLKDGTYRVTAQVFTGAGEKLGRAAQTFEVIGGLAAQTEKLLQEFLAARVTALELAGKKGLRATVAVRTESDVYALRERQILALISAGQYEDAQAATRKAQEEIEALRRELGGK